MKRWLVGALIFSLLILSSFIIFVYNSNTSHLEIDDLVMGEIWDDPYIDPKINFYPSSREVELKKGGKVYVEFNFSKSEIIGKSFSYNISADELDKNCQINLNEAKEFITRGSSGEDIIFEGKPILIELFRPRETSDCYIAYKIRTYIEGEPYSSAHFFVNFK